MFGGNKGNSQTAALQQQIFALQAELEEKNQQLKLAQTELNAVNTNTHLGLWQSFYDEQGNPTNVLWSDEFLRMLGYNRSELSDSIDSLGPLLHPDEADQVYAAFGAVLADKTNRTKYDIDYRLKVKNGSYRWFHAAGQLIRRPDGTPIEFIGTFTDIHDAKINAEEFEVNQRRADAVDKMMLEGSWSMDLTKYAIDDPNSPMVYSDQFKKILGFSGSDFPDIMNSWITRIHPDDVGGASEAMGKQLADPLGQTVFDMEYRIKHKDGHWVWTRASSYVVWSRDRRMPLMAAGTILDITEEKKNRLRFEEEMAPNIESLRKGISEIASTVDMATKQMTDMAEKQIDVANSAKQIGESVSASMSIITSIQSIADQTNLLSLNASIEAARAGEAGRGFAVVAGEVQNLSTSTKETTNQIGKILNEMNDSVKNMLGKIEVISSEVTDESAEMEEIDATVEGLHQAADEIAIMAETLYK